MDSFIVEDVNALLKIKKGDSSRLYHIKELCEANEIVTLSDRKYIERLASQYLNKVEQKKPKNTDKPRLISIEEPASTTQPLETDTSKLQTDLLKEAQMDRNLNFKKNNVKIFNLSSNKKILFGSAAIMLAIILVAIVGIQYNYIQIPNGEEIKGGPISEFSLETDVSTYETTDIISISGMIPSSSSGIVQLSIENENNESIWTENVNLKIDGSFSTLLIAGGVGWENSGKYALVGEHGGLSNQISFEFVARK